MSLWLLFFVTEKASQPIDIEPDDVHLPLLAIQTHAQQPTSTTNFQVKHLQDSIIIFLISFFLF